MPQRGAASSDSIVPLMGAPLSYDPNHPYRPFLCPRTQSGDGSGLPQDASMFEVFHPPHNATAMMQRSANGRWHLLPLKGGELSEDAEGFATYDDAYEAYLRDAAKYIPPYRRDL